MQAVDWFKREERREFPSLKRGAIFLSAYHGNWISRMITRMQGVGSEWSHTGVYVGFGMVAEATFPKGRIGPLKRYMSPSYTFEIYNIPELDSCTGALVSSEAIRLAPRPYDVGKILGHMLDNFVERLTWNSKTQRGWRPIEKWFHPDLDRDRANVCSELVGRAVEHATGELGGAARPLDVWAWLQSKNLRPVLRHERGDVQAAPLGTEAKDQA